MFITPKVSIPKTLIVSKNSILLLLLLKFSKVVRFLFYKIKRILAHHKKRLCLDTVWENLQIFNCKEPKTDTFSMHPCNVVHRHTQYVSIVHDFIGVELGNALVLDLIPLKLLTRR